MTRATLGVDLGGTNLRAGVVDAAVHSVAENKPIVTPGLELSYAAKDFRAFREMGESWKIVTDDIKEPDGWAERPLRR